MNKQLNNILSEEIVIYKSMGENPEISPNVITYQRGRKDLAKKILKLINNE